VIKLKPLGPKTLDDENPSDAASASWFYPSLIAVVFLGLIVRLGFAISVMSRSIPGDALFFHTTAANIANGKGYSVATDYGPVHLTLAPTAGHPPVFPTLLAFFDLLGFRSVDSQRIVLSVVASSGILVMGLLGRKVAGPVVGIAAAAIAAVDPLWFQSSGILMSESIYLVVIPTIMLLALICLENPRCWRFGAVGIAIGIAVLTRSEAVWLLVLLGVPLAVLAAGPWRRRLSFILCVAGGAALILVPWLIRNEVQLGGFVLADDSGGTLVGSYNPVTFDPNSPAYGSFDVFYSDDVAGYFVLDQRPPDGGKQWSERTLNNALTPVATNFARSHWADMPGVVLARESAVWGFPDQRWEMALAGGEGRVKIYEDAGQIFYWVKLPFVLIGAFVLARTSRRIFVVIAIPIVVVALNAALFYGSTRMRVAAEPSLAVLAAIGLVILTRALRDLRAKVSSRAT
jgi:hypothetical protein